MALAFRNPTRHALAATIVSVTPLFAGAQSPDADWLAQATALVASVSADLECEIELIGDIRADALLGRRYVAYSAAGSDCDAAAETLAGRGAEMDLQFLRRPSVGQLRALVAGIIRSVETTTGCRIAMRGTPSLNAETSRWLVTYVTTGDTCENIDAMLREQGSDLDISFVGGPARR